MQINVKADLRKAERFLLVMEKRQIPFATSLALNRTAEAIQRLEKRKIVQDLDRPTPQVVKSIRVQRSHKRRLTAAVFILPAISRFLRYQIHGGTRPPRGHTEAVPVKLGLNKYGNIAGRRQGKLKKLLAKPDTFSGTINGVSGIWQRGRGRMRNKRVKLLVAYETVTRYRPRFPFYRYAEDAARRAWPRQFVRAFRRAIRG